MDAAASPYAPSWFDRLQDWVERRTESGFQRFADDPTHLSDVVRFDLSRLGDASGLRWSTSSATSARTRIREG